MNQHKHIRKFIENVAFFFLNVPLSNANIKNPAREIVCHDETGPRTQKGWAPLV
jgi:hypothetical protein